MPLALQCLLRLPACLRRQAVLDHIPQKPLAFNQSITGNTVNRTFSITSQTLRQARPAKPTRKAPAPKSQPPPLRPTTSPASQPQAQTSKPISYAETLFASNNEVLLYRAPRHLSFFITSYIAGSLLVLGAYNWATLALKRPPGQEDFKPGVRGWFLTSVSTLTTLFLAIAGTAIILAPAKMVRTITALHPSYSGIGLPTLRFEMRSPLPFMRTKTIEVLPSETFLDRRVSAVEIDLTSVPLTRAADFTASKQANASLPAAAARQGAVARAWTTLLRDTRRMFLRDGFTYVRFKEQGNWKLDLQDCELLDNGRVLERLTRPDMAPGTGVIALLRRKFFA
ncbi:hypothetical protein LTR85_009688 [Meristemomyces frigidus]|nr:hypothetical protein LTR85_009688 [Meristemomyces frigidus]